VENGKIDRRREGESRLNFRNFTKRYLRMTIRSKGWYRHLKLCLETCKSQITNDSTISRRISCGEICQKILRRYLNLSIVNACYRYKINQRSLLYINKLNDRSYWTAVLVTDDIEVGDTSCSRSRAHSLAGMCRFINAKCKKYLIFDINMLICVYKLWKQKLSSWNEHFKIK